jgi:hypothetical protein
MWAFALARSTADVPGLCWIVPQLDFVGRLMVLGVPLGHVRPFRSHIKILTRNRTRGWTRKREVLTRLGFVQARSFGFAEGNW